MDRFGHRVAGVATHVLHHKGQLALVEQFQGIAGPQQWADVVVAGVIDMGAVIHASIVMRTDIGCAGGWPRCLRTANNT